MSKSIQQRYDEHKEFFGYNHRKFYRDSLPLAKEYIENNLSLVLGAGVSAQSNIPLWNDLLNLLVLKILEGKAYIHGEFTESQLDAITKYTLHSLGESPLIQLRYIKASLETKNFKELLYKTLYNKDFTSETDILKEITSLCSGVKCNNDKNIKNVDCRINNIITYNFDDMLEQALNKRNIEYNVIFDEKNKKSPSSLNIYHVHGYLPYKNNESSETFVFSEDDYHVVYNDVYHWSNIVQLNCFRENVCLFIGCSLTDPNIRRLLDASHKHSHYAIMKRNTDKLNLENFFDEGVINRLISINEKMTENYYLSIGIKIIWVNEYNDIPELLQTITAIALFEPDLCYLPENIFK